MKKAVVFDLDGTLVNTIESFVYSANRAIGDFGFAPYTAEDFKQFVGEGQDELIRRMLRKAGDTELAYFERVKEKYGLYFEKGCMHGIFPYAGIPELLEKLREKGCKLFVFSNKRHEHTLSVLEKMFGGGYFDDVQGQCDELPRKPDPAGALSMLKRHGLLPGECLYVGDTWTDMKAGKAAGMYTIGVLWGFRGREELLENGADALVEMPAEILYHIIN